MLWPRLPPNFRTACSPLVVVDAVRPGSAAAVSAAGEAGTNFATADPSAVLMNGGISGVGSPEGSVAAVADEPSFPACTLASAAALSAASLSAAAFAAAAVAAAAAAYSRGGLTVLRAVGL